MNKKFLAKLLIFCMIFTMLPMTAFGAADNAVYTVNVDATPTQINVGSTATVSVESVTYKVGSDTKTVTEQYTPTYAITAGGDYATIKGATVTGVAAGEVTVTATVTLNGQSYTGTVVIEVLAANMPAVTDGKNVVVTLPTSLAGAGTNEPERKGVYKCDGDTVIKMLSSDSSTTEKVTVKFTTAAIDAMKTANTPIVFWTDLGKFTLEQKVLGSLADGDTFVLAKNTSTIAVPDKTKQVAAFDVSILDSANKAKFTTTDTTRGDFEVAWDMGTAPALAKLHAYYVVSGAITDEIKFGKEDARFVNLVMPHFSTVVLTEDETTDPGPTTSGGGGSSSNVSIATKVTGGKVTVTPTRPTRGQTVTITVTPADGYKLESLKVTDLKGNEIELTKVSDNKYTFVMPAGKVTVTPVFTKIDGSDKDDNTTNVNKRFSDVATDAWYAEYINYVAENGLMNGYEDGRFGPNDQTTRAQIVTVLYRMEGEPAVQNASSFKDVSAGGQYYSSAVAWAARNNIVNGYEDGRFAPNDNVTREQIAAILYRYAAYKEYDTTLAGNIASFSDAARVSSWATDAIAWAVGEGLMNGDNGALRPQGNATRAEIAALLMRFAENIAK